MYKFKYVRKINDRELCCLHRGRNMKRLYTNFSNKTPGRFRYRLGDDLTIWYPSDLALRYELLK
jgi:hypothetical protein